MNVFLRAIPNNQPDASLDVIDEMIQSGVAALCTVVAVIIAAFIDAAKYHRLGIYHATIACYLCLMLLFSAFAPIYFTLSWVWRNANASETSRKELLREMMDHVGKSGLVWSVICWFAQIALGSFGLWIYVLVASHPYDDSPTATYCGSSTHAWFMGTHYIVGVEGPWQRMWLAFYATLIVPLLLPFLILFLLDTVGTLIQFIIYRVGLWRRTPVYRYVSFVDRTWPIFGLGIVLAVLCAMTEKTVQANHVDVGDRPWGQGQIFPILTAGIPAYQLLKPLWERFFPSDASLPRSGKAVSADGHTGLAQAKV